MPQTTAKLTRPPPKWHPITAECLVSNDGRYGVALLMGGWYAYRRLPQGGTTQIGEVLDSREMAEQTCEAHRWGHVGDDGRASGTVASGVLRAGS